MAELDAGRIATAALAVLDERGTAGFTIRAVAESLHVTPMALYHHVADKAALAGLVIEAALGETPLPPPTGVSWQEDLWAMARWTRTTSHAHPALVPLRRQYRVWTPTMSAMGERWFNIWLQTGFPLDLVVPAATTSSMAIFGVVAEEIMRRDVAPPDSGSLSWFPNLRVAFALERDPDADFELFVRSLVEGLYARLAATVSR